MAQDHNTYRRRRHREIGYGRWKPWADPEPVRDHVRQLRDQGAAYRAIAAAAGVPTMSVHALVNGGSQVKAETADALMGVTPDRLNLARVPATGTARRLRALIAAGHSQERISQALGCHPDTVRHLVRGTAATVAPDLRADAHRLYDAWWDRWPPERTREERTAAEAARRRAERAGWPTGAGLDDDRIEERGYVPQAGWRRMEGTGPAPEDPLGRQQHEPPVQLAVRCREARPEPPALEAAAGLAQAQARTQAPEIELEAG